jgi:hypothetical protein
VWGDNTTSVSGALIRRVVPAIPRFLQTSGTFIPRPFLSVPADSAGFGSGHPASARGQLVAPFAQLYRAVVMYCGGLPGVELIELCRMVGSDRLSARQIVELHALAADQVTRENMRFPDGLSSRLNKGLVLAVPWLNGHSRFAQCHRACLLLERGRGAAYYRGKQR